jgi:hypothetical protein
MISSRAQSPEQLPGQAACMFLPFFDFLARQAPKLTNSSRAHVVLVLVAVHILVLLLVVLLLVVLVVILILVLACCRLVFVVLVVFACVASSSISSSWRRPSLDKINRSDFAKVERVFAAAPPPMLKGGSGTIKYVRASTTPTLKGQLTANPRTCFSRFDRLILSRVVGRNFKEYDGSTLLVLLLLGFCFGFGVEKFVGQWGPHAT